MSKIRKCLIDKSLMHKWSILHFDNVYVLKFTLFTFKSKLNIGKKKNHSTYSRKQGWVAY